MGNCTVSSRGEIIVNGGVDISPEPSFVGETLASLLKNTLEQAEKCTEIRNLENKISGLLRDNSNCFRYLYKFGRWSLLFLASR